MDINNRTSSMTLISNSLRNQPRLLLVPAKRNELTQAKHTNLEAAAMRRLVDSKREAASTLAHSNSRVMEDTVNSKANSLAIRCLNTGQMQLLQHWEDPHMASRLKMSEVINLQNLDIQVLAAQVSSPALVASRMV